jgi:hypothetical protein
MSLRLLRPADSRIFFDSCVLINWIGKQENIEQGQEPLSQYLISKYLHSGSVMFLLPTVAPEMRMWGETVCNRAKSDDRALEYLSRFEHLLSLAEMRPAPQPLPSEALVRDIHNILVRLGRDRKDHTLRERMQLHARLRMDAISLAMIAEMNKEGSAGICSLVTVNRRLINAAKIINEAEQRPEPSYLARDVYGPAWGSFCDSTNSVDNIEYMGYISKAIVLSQQYLAKVVKTENWKSETLNLQTLHKAIEDVARFAERFHSDVERQAYADNEASVELLRAWSRQIEGGAHVLKELIASILFQISTFPTMPPL